MGLIVCILDGTTEPAVDECGADHKIAQHFVLSAQHNLVVVAALESWLHG